MSFRKGRTRPTRNLLLTVKNCGSRFLAALGMAGRGTFIRIGGPKANVNTRDDSMKSCRLEKKTAARAGIQARLLGGEEWNQLADLGFIGLPSILGDLKRLSMLDRSRLCAIPFSQSLLPFRQRGAGTLFGEPFRAGRRLLR